MGEWIFMLSLMGFSIYVICFKLYERDERIHRVNKAVYSDDVITMTAEDFKREFTLNEYAAREKFTAKKLRLTGTITRIEFNEGVSGDGSHPPIWLDPEDLGLGFSYGGVGRVDANGLILGLNGGAFDPGVECYFLSRIKSSEYGRTPNSAEVKKFMMGLKVGQTITVTGVCFNFEHGLKLYKCEQFMHRKG